jgi:hypothetical protein
MLQRKLSLVLSLAYFNIYMILRIFSNNTYTDEQKAGKFFIQHP